MMNLAYNIEFLNKGYFILLFIIPLLVFLFYKKQKKGDNFIFFEDLKKIFKNNSIIFYIQIILLALILINYVIILANPNTTNSSETIKKNGIDIILALDVSSSMDANDLTPSRMEAAKTVINNFIGKLKTDRAGLVVFAGKPFTSIPLTFDYNILKETISNLSTDNINQQRPGLNGTAIGDAILMSKTLFKKDEDREKVIILVTDGDANVGVEPTLAGLSAKQDGIKIYTVGIGSQNGGFMNYNMGGFVQKIQIPPLNDTTLKQIAKDTSGEYFRAENNQNLNSIFDKLQELDKNEIKMDIKKEFDDYYKPFLITLNILLAFFIVSIFYKIQLTKDL